MTTTAWDHIMENGEHPTRWCQALEDLDPRHEAEVVVTGSNGTGQWFSCRAHVPKSATDAEDIRQWFTRNGLTYGV